MDCIFENDIQVLILVLIKNTDKLFKKIFGLRSGSKLKRQSTIKICRCNPLCSHLWSDYLNADKNQAVYLVYQSALKGDTEGLIAQSIPQLIKALKYLIRFQIRPGWSLASCSAPGDNHRCHCPDDGSVTCRWVVYWSVSSKRSGIELTFWLIILKGPRRWNVYCAELQLMRWV